MGKTLQQIPPEAWPFIDLLFNLTMAAASIWLAITVFVIWRRHASNLTPVNSVEKRKSAQPDFLKVDKKAREAAIERGESFDQELDRRDREAEKELRRKRKSNVSIVQGASGLIALVMSLFTLASMIYGSIFTVSRMGTMMEEYSTLERLLAVIYNHPIAFAITVLVIVARIYTYYTTDTAEG